MVKRQQQKVIEDQKQVNALAEFAPRIRELLRQYKDKRKLASIAKQLGFHPSRLTEMITKDRNGNYKRMVTPYYVAKFIDGGFMTVEQIVQNRRLDTLPDRVRIYFERMALSRETIQLVLEAQHRGIDLDKILTEILYSNSKKEEASRR